MYKLCVLITLCSSYPEFVLTGVLSIKKALKGQKSVRINESLLYSIKYSITVEPR